MNRPKLIFKICPIWVHQSDWRDTWRSRAMCTGVTHGQARILLPTWRHVGLSCDSVAPTAVARLTTHSSCVTWALVTPERTARLSHARLFGVTKRKIKPLPASSSLSLLLLSLLISSLPKGDPHCRHHCRHRPPFSDPCSCWSSFLVVPQGFSPFLIFSYCME
jgi:hypothetical protein